MIESANFALFCSTNSYDSAHVADGQAISAYQYVGVLYMFFENVVMALFTLFRKIRIASMPNIRLCNDIFCPHRMIYSRFPEQ